MAERSPVVMPVAVSTRLEADAEAARLYAEAARSDATLRAYRADWADFTLWCDERAARALPASPDTVALYVASRARSGPGGGPPLKVSTLTRRLAAISQAHKLAGVASPASRQDEPLHSVWRGLVRSLGSAPNKVAPALAADIRAMVAEIPLLPVLPSSPEARAAALRARRDRALLLVGFAGALRRSELAALRAEDVVVTADGLRLSIPRSKTDQEGSGHAIGIAYGEHAATCPVRVLQSWMRTLRAEPGVESLGPLFRKVDRWGRLAERAITPRTVALVVKARAEAAGLDPRLYAGHSLRAGFATQAAKSGKSDRSIMRHTRHKSLATLNEYVREGRLFDDNASSGIGL